jgi:hypothetical protein
MVLPGSPRITIRFWPMRAPEVYTPEPKLSSGASFTSLMEKYVWQYNFHSFTQSRRKSDTLISYPATLRGGRYRFDNIVVNCGNSMGCDRNLWERKRCRILYTFVC